MKFKTKQEKQAMVLDYEKGADAKRNRILININKK